jgi:hypothetical protein
MQMRPRAWIPTLGLLAAAAAALPLWAAPAAESATPATPTVVTPSAATAATTSDVPAGRKIVKVVKIADSAPAPTMQQLVVVRDAETGKMRQPTAAEWEKMKASIDPLYRSDAGLEEIYYEDGSVGMVLGDRYMSMMLVQRGADGKLAPTCTHDAQAATDILTGTSVAPAEARNDQ